MTQSMRFDTSPSVPFEPGFCETARRLGREGRSQAAIASAIGVSTATLRRWANQHPAFREALIEAHDFARAWWEGMAMTGGVRTAVWRHTMETRFREDHAKEAAWVAAQRGDAIDDRDVTKLSTEELVREIQEIAASMV